MFWRSSPAEPERNRLAMVNEQAEANVFQWSGAPIPPGYSPFTRPWRDGACPYCDAFPAHHEPKSGEVSEPPLTKREALEWAVRLRPPGGRIIGAQYLAVADLILEWHNGPQPPMPREEQPA